MYKENKTIQPLLKSRGLLVWKDKYGESIYNIRSRY